jgi:hypothetical protein
MSTIKNISGEPRFVPGLGRVVLEGQEVEVPADVVTAYTQQEQTWAPADDEAQDLHDEMLEGIAALLVDEVAADGDDSDDSDGAQGGARAVVAGLATADRPHVETRVTVVRAAEARLAELDQIDAEAALAAGGTNDSQEG